MPVRLPVFGQSEPISEARAARRIKAFERLTVERTQAVDVDTSRSSFRLELSPEPGISMLSWLPRIEVHPPARAPVRHERA